MIHGVLQHDVEKTYRGIPERTKSRLLEMKYSEWKKNTPA